MVESDPKVGKALKTIRSTKGTSKAWLIGGNTFWGP